MARKRARPHSHALILNSAFLIVLIAEAADGKAVVLVVAVAAHDGEVAVQVAVPSEATGGLRSTPEVGVVTEIVVAIAVVVAGRQRTETSGVVGALVIPHTTCSSFYVCTN